MRLASPNTYDQLNQAQATEPQLIIQVNWGGGLSYYATKSIQFPNGVYCESRIISLGELSSQRREDNFASTGSISFSLDDTDGKLKFVMDATRSEKRPAAVYLHYEGNGFNDLLLLLKGEIIGPISWSEGQRVFDFTIEVVQDHNEFGFSPTKDDFSDLSDDAVGIPWPVAFGKVAHVPAVHVTKRTVGTLITDIRLDSNIYNLKVSSTGTPTDLVMDTAPHLRAFIPDVTGAPSVTEDTDIMYIWRGETFPQNTDIKIVIDGVIFQGQFTQVPPGTPTNKFTIKKDSSGKVTGINLPKYQNVSCAARQDPVEMTTDDKGNSVIRRDKNGNAVHTKQYNKLWLADATKSIANDWVYMKVPSGKPEWINFCNQQEKTECTFKYPFVDPNAKDPKNANRTVAQPTLITKLQSIDSVYPIPKNGYEKDIVKNIERLRATLLNAGGAAGNKSNVGTIQSILTRLRADKAGFWSRPADTVVRLYVDDPKNPQPDLYICNLAPVTKVLSVYGRRKIYDKKVFVQIPETYYSVLTSNYQIKGSFVTAIAFNTPLLDYQDQNWDDNIYVSMQCNIGPNVSDIIKWIVQTFTSYLIDKPSFDLIATRLANWPANFVLFERRDAIKVVAEIAWQARCALVIDSDSVSLKQLSRKPIITNMTLDSSNIEFKSMILGFTEAKEIKTKLIGIWTETYKDFPPPTRHNEKVSTEIKEIVRAILKEGERDREATRYLVYRENTNIYGNVPREENIFIFNTETNVWQTLLFWGHRLANSWRTVKLKGFMPAVLLQPLDWVFLNTPQLVAQYALVDRIAFNPETYDVSIDLWCPMIAGALIPDDSYFVDQ